MHPKKIEEVRQWLQRADVSLQLGLPPTPRLLLLSGPPGSGKTALLHVLAAEQQFETCEWVEPRSDPWEVDSLDSSRSRSDQHPRAAAFATFLRNSLRTLSLCVVESAGESTTSGGASSSTLASMGRRRLVILDDLAPAGQGTSASAQDLREQQMVFLERALAWARFPIALVLSTDASSTVHHVVERFRGIHAQSQSLVSHIQVNALANTFMLKTLQHVCKQERLALSRDDLAVIANSSNGDLRSALQSMQFLAGRPLNSAHQKSTHHSTTSSGKRARAGAATHADSLSNVGQGERDRFPDMFQAINSILYRPIKRVKLRLESDVGVQGLIVAKEQRDTQRMIAAEASSAEIPAIGSHDSSKGVTDFDAGCESQGNGKGEGCTKLQEPGSDADFSPEAIIESSAFEEPSAAAFLHQNYPEFFSEIQDLAEAAGCLSDASFVADAHRRRPWQTQLLPYVASLAGRGVVSRNHHPAPSRQHPVRKPHLYAVERDAADRAKRIANAFHPDVSSGRLCGTTELACDLLPFLRVAAQRGGVNCAHIAELSDRQWEVMVELTTFSGRPAPARDPVGGGVMQRTSSEQVHQRPPTTTATQLEDDIEDCD